MKELTKEQVQRIDDYLKKEGIKYWDLRMEMIDHIVTDIESQNQSVDFDSKFQQSIIQLGWDKNLSDYNKIGWKNTNSIFRRNYHRNILSFFTSFKRIALLCIGFYILYFLSERLNFTTFSKISFVIFYLPLIIILIFNYRSFKNKLGKSVNIDYAIFYLTVGSLILPSAFIILKTMPEVYGKLMLIVLICIQYITFYSGYKVCKTAFLKIEKIKKMLL